MAEALTASRIAAPHGFFTRRGGVSTGPYASLNCGLSGQDDRTAVLENRARVARALSVHPEHLVGLTQVHGRTAVTVRRPWAVGQGERADAMVTDQPGLALGIVTADCAPVLLASTNGTIVGAAHAGWRGAVGGVLEATVAAMAGLGACPGEITAAIGPCIAQHSYEVGADLRDAVLDSAAATSSAAAGVFDPGSFASGFFTPGRRADRWQFDLAGYCAARLRAAGVAEVVITGRDTLTEAEDFFSHRRRTLTQAGPIGHQISVIRAKP